MGLPWHAETTRWNVAVSARLASPCSSTGIQGDRPSVVVPSSVRIENKPIGVSARPILRGRSLPREISRKIGEVAVFGFLDRAAAPRAENPFAGRATPSHGVDYQISANLFARCRAYPCNVRHTRDGRCARDQFADLDTRRIVTLGAACAIAATAHQRSAFDR